MVTGATSGFGKLIALTFARNGYCVYATTRENSPEKIGATEELAKKENLSLKWIELDVTKPETIARAEQVIRKNGGLDILVNNAGFGVLGAIETYTADDVQKQLDTNFLGAVRMTYAFLPLLKQSDHGRIIIMSSIAGVLVAPAYGLYSASKHALEAFHEALRYELFASNVSVSLVEPGGFDTSFSVNARGLSPEENSKHPTWYKNAIAFRNKRIGTENNIISKRRDPQVVANLVFTIAQTRKPKLRNFVGTGAFTGYLFRRFFPNVVWEWIMVNMLKRLVRS